MIKFNRNTAPFFLCFILFYSCKTYHRNSAHKDVSSINIEKGEALAKIYCQSCHMLPDPSLLDTKSWEKGVLPEMAPRLGIFNFGFEVYPRSRDKNIGNNFYPSQPVMSLTDWQNILDYYTATSPDSLPAQKRNEPIKTGLSFFKVEIPQINYPMAATCYVKINSQDTSHPIIISDAIKQNLYFINRKLEITDSVIGAGPVVDIDFTKSFLLACNIGVLNPNNGKFGKVEIIELNSNGQMHKDAIPLIDSLQRPVQIVSADLNNDGKQDYIVCEFGYLTGSLSWMENLGNNKFQRHVLRNAPGAIKAYVQDFNHDGKPDILALFAQGEEGIFLFTNKGNGNFDQEEVLRFPPSYGSSSFELADFNKDGYPDIVYTCGDNADFSPVLKPYHGVYIFMNDKTNHFKQKYFFPINGCYKAIARDFDGDGDLDVATISFFADYARQPEESFVYLKNNGNFDFQPYTFPEANMGRWLTMDAGDIDGDGKTDIILGNFSIGPVMMKHKVDWKHSPPFIVLKNMGK
ncbi:MAG: VCBS repeat-containing protein [Bacteroidota bacterium]|nr:VCBS repeat-containing protein [Bacteroidota bacterium]